MSTVTCGEITPKCARAYRQAPKKDKGRLLDELTAVTGWSRDNARRRLAQAAEPRLRAVKVRKPRARKYSDDATVVLQRVWAISGYECGKYLAVSMATLLSALERHGELTVGKDRYSSSVRAELLAMSAATIDRYLAPARAHHSRRGVSTTHPVPVLRGSILRRWAGDEIEDAPGFFEGDTVAHCGPTTTGEFARTVNLTCLHTGWVFTRSIRDHAHVHVHTVLSDAVEQIPFEVVGLEFGNGSEVTNHDVIAWALERKIFVARSRPHGDHDRATIGPRDNHFVRRYGFHGRYDTPEALTTLNRLWPLVNDRLNFFTPTRKPIGYANDSAGRRRRAYDTPATPIDRLLAAGVLSPAQEAELRARRDALNPADLTRRIHSLQARLTGRPPPPTP